MTTYSEDIVPVPYSELENSVMVGRVITINNTTRSF
jgi:hypothetical protein